ncbi:clipb17 [Anopheles sinensis]|uniref:Clipb17 n=1 Tax=Anopheles sinensis TaxID=74873 RepID=A0A084VGU0_ANOSI|nr:clipb17 [Anopheles sinensis]
MQEISIDQRIVTDMYDDALRRLTNTPEVDGSMVRPICLPLSGVPVYANHRMSVSKTSHLLSKAESPVVLSEENHCSQSYKLCICRETVHTNCVVE